MPRYVHGIKPTLNTKQFFIFEKLLSIFYFLKTLVIVTKEKGSSISLFIVEKHFMVARMGQKMFSLKPIITTLNLSWMLSHCKNKDCWFGQMATSWPLNKPIHNDPRSLVTNRVPTLCVEVHCNFFQACFLFLPNDCLLWWCVMNLILNFIFLSTNCQHCKDSMHKALYCAHCARFYYATCDSIISASLSY